MGLIFILTGAGISAESGIGTFRDKGGLWSKVDINDVATPKAFERDPELVYDFHNMRRAKVAQARPNAAHRALAKLEVHKRVQIVTQNVDNLHEQAGSRSVIHMHGEHKNAYCSTCHARWPATLNMSAKDYCPECHSQTVRPDIVWFGEKANNLEQINAVLIEASTFVAIGTSGLVYPAAGLVRLARQSGAKCLEFNLEDTKATHKFDEVRRGPAGTIVPAWVEEVLSGP